MIAPPRIVLATWVLLALALVWSLPARVPPPDVVRDAEALGRAFVEGRTHVLSERFTPSLAARLGPEELARRSLDVRTRGGAIRRIQAPWVQDEGRGLQQLVIPIDLENADFDLILEWRPTTSPRAISGFWTTNRRKRPSPDTTAEGLVPTFTDAPYVDREKFSEVPLALDPARFDPRSILVARPADPGPVPLVILLPNRLAIDIDGSFGRNKAARDLAHGLASRGVAVVRLAPRPPGETKDLESFALDEARELVRLAREAAWVQQESVYTAGFQEGALAAFELARTSRLAGVVMLAPPERVSVEAELRHQAILAEAGLVDPEHVRFLEALRDRDLEHEVWPSDIFHDAPFSFWHSFAVVDPLSRPAAFPGDALVIFGSRDYLVTQAERARWVETTDGLPNWWVRTKAGVSRWLIPGDGTPLADLRSYGHVDVDVIERVEKFVKATELRRRAREKARGTIR